MRRNVNYELLEKRRAFRAFYDEKLKGDYQELEEKRKPYLLSFWLRALMLAAAIAVYMYLVSVIEGAQHFLDENDWLSEVLLFVFLLWCVYIWQPVENYKEDTKKLVMNKILSFWGDLTYKTCPGAAHSLPVLKQSRLFGNFNRRDYDDCFEGSYNGVKIAVSEQELRDVRGSGKNRRDVQIFKGILISLAMPKKFHGQTVVHAKGRGAVLAAAVIALFAVVIGAAISMEVFEKRDVLPFVIFFPLSVFLMCGGFWIIKDWFNKRKKMQQVALEDVVFDKHWKVESTDQIEARYVLTPAFMERMLAMKKRFKGRKIEFSFWNNKVLIAVHTGKDMFETTSLFTPALDYRKVQEVVAQFWAVFSVVDVLLKGEQKK